MKLERLAPGDCARLLRESRRTVALTGAGISTAAGVPDFRGPQGIYASGRYDLEATFEIAGFMKDPRPFFRFAREVLGICATVEPTATHRFLARLEAQGRLEAVITQNVDALHQRAGSRRVIAVHGDFGAGHCLGCRKGFATDALAGLIREHEVPRCACGGVVKPDVVLFGEEVRGMEEAAALVAASELLLVLGSSLSVYPVAFLPALAGGAVAAVNRGPAELAPGPFRYLAEADLDEFFAGVAAELSLQS